MEPAFQRLDLQFLDLSDATEEDQNVIQRLLFNENFTELQLPWQTDKTCNEAAGSTGAGTDADIAGVEADDVSAVPQALSGDWTNEFESPDIEDNATLASNHSSSRGQPPIIASAHSAHFPPTQQVLQYAYITTPPQMFLNNTPYPGPTHYTTGPHAYHELEPPRGAVPPRSVKKIDKKSQEPSPTAPSYIPQYYHAHPSSYVYPVPMYSPAIYSPVVYPHDYHPGYITSAEQQGGGFEPEPPPQPPNHVTHIEQPEPAQQQQQTSITPTNALQQQPQQNDQPHPPRRTTPPGFPAVVTTIPSPSGLVPTASSPAGSQEATKIKADVVSETPGAKVPEIQKHEHVCYHADVVVKAPTGRKKPVEESSSLNPSTSTSKADSGSLTTTPSPSTNTNDCVANGVVESDSDMKQPNNHSAMPPKKPTSRKPSSDYPVVGQTTTSDERANIVTTTNGGRSWASLFEIRGPSVVMDSNVDSGSGKGKPLARVPPFVEPSKVPSGGEIDEPSQVANANTNNVTINGEVNSGGAISSNNVPNVTVKFADDPYAHQLSEILSSYKQDHKSISLQPRGLQNRSNWCYVNAILQALMACPSFVNLIKALPKPTVRRPTNSHTPITDSMIEFVNEFVSLPHSVRNKREKSARNTKDEQQSASDVPVGSIFEPDCIYKVLNKIRGESGFSVEGRQEDAEEFLSCLLNGLNDEMFELMKLSGAATNGQRPLPNGVGSGNADDDDGGEGGSEGGEWATVHGPRNASYTGVIRRADCGETPLSQLFRGQLRNRVQRTGSYDTNNVQPFFTLPLDIEKVDSVKQALELLVGKDQLEGITCSKTNQEIEAWTQITLEDLPQILILHLKCFDYKHNGCSKIVKTVDFPVDLKIDPKIVSAINKSKYSAKQRSYKLLAVVYHDGKEASKGHYLTDAYHVGLGCWIRYDDQNVRRVNEAQVLKTTLPRVPYLLYYRRSDTIAATTSQQQQSK